MTCVPKKIPLYKVVTATGDSNQIARGTFRGKTIIYNFIIVRPTPYVQPLVSHGGFDSLEAVVADNVVGTIGLEFNPVVIRVLEVEAINFNPASIT
jgi:hypothetical protein